MADDPKFSKHTITNVSDGPKVVNAKTVITLQPGESADVEMTEGEFASAKSTEWFGFGAKAAKEAAKDAEGETQA